MPWHKDPKAIHVDRYVSWIYGGCSLFWWVKDILTHLFQMGPKSVACPARQLSDSWLYWTNFVAKFVDDSRGHMLKSPEKGYHFSIVASKKHRVSESELPYSRTMKNESACSTSALLIIFVWMKLKWCFEAHVFQDHLSIVFRCWFQRFWRDGHAASHALIIFLNEKFCWRSCIASRDLSAPGAMTDEICVTYKPGTMIIQLGDLMDTKAHSVCNSLKSLFGDLSADVRIDQVCGEVDILLFLGHLARNDARYWLFRQFVFHFSDAIDAMILGESASSVSDSVQLKHAQRNRHERREAAEKMTC